MIDGLGFGAWVPRTRSSNIQGVGAITIIKYVKHTFWGSSSFALGLRRFEGSQASCHMQLHPMSGKLEAGHLVGSIS